MADAASRDPVPCHQALSLFRLNNRQRIPATLTKTKAPGSLRGPWSFQRERDLLAATQAVNISSHSADFVFRQAFRLHLCLRYCERRPGRMRAASVIAPLGSRSNACTGAERIASWPVAGASAPATPPKTAPSGPRPAPMAPPAPAAPRAAGNASEKERTPPGRTAGAGRSVAAAERVKSVMGVVRPTA